MSLKKISLVALVLSTLLSVSAQATTISFDDMRGEGQRVPTDYQGFKWTGFGVLNNTSSYGNHASSGNVYAYAYCCGDNDTISSANGTFNFVDADLSSLQGITESYTIKGYLGANELYSKVISVTGTIASYTFGFMGVDKISFSTSWMGNLALDNVRLTADVEVPEPASAVLLGLGFAGLLASRRKAKRA